MLRSLLLIVLAIPLGIRAANAAECRVTGPRYQLRSDTVEWEMKTRIGQSCIRGVRFNNVANPVIKIISPPRFGELSLLGPSFSYKAGTGFQSEDTFTLEVSGSVGRVAGTSTIRVVVTSFGEPPAPSSAAPAQGSRPLAPTPVPIPGRPAESIPDNTAPVPAGSSLPPCPIWDWSKGAPPPMRPPFDRSKLYCPPPLFHPPSPPTGCVCTQ